MEEKKKNEPKKDVPTNEVTKKQETNKNSKTAPRKSFQGKKIEKKNAIAKKEANQAPKQEANVKEESKKFEPVKKETVKQEKTPEVKKEVKPEVQTGFKVEIPSGESKDAKPKFQKVQQQPKRKSGGKRGLVLFVFLLIIAGVVAAWFYIPEFRNLFNQNNSNTSVSQESKKIEDAKEWEKAYAKVLKENYNAEEVKNLKIQLITIDEEDKIPALAVCYANTAGKVLDIWQADEDGEINNKIEKCNTSDEVLKVLYDVKNEKYDWYLYLENTNQKGYGSISRLMKEAKKTTNNTSQLKYSLFDYVVSDKQSLSNISVEQFNQKFIELDKEDLIKTWIEYKKENSESDTLELLRKENSKKKTAREVVADYAKEGVLNKAEKLAKGKEGIILGEEVLKYGTYTATINETSEAVIVITADKTCSYSGFAPDGSQKEIHSTGTYEVKPGTDGIGVVHADMIVFTLKDESKFEFIIEKNTFKNDVIKFNFKSDDTKLKEGENSNVSSVVENNNNLITPMGTENTPNTNTVPTNTIEPQTKTVQPSTNENTVDIGKEEALKLVQKVHGTSPDGKKIGYYYLAWVKDSNDNKYYAYRVSYLVDESRYSFVDTILISADGKNYKQIVTPENFTDGQVVTKFDSEKNF